ncbi:MULTISPECIES: iron-containing redox enzyme family protein [Rhodococcus erythropolis group]|uniref:iron-containing redox enzyme family protein n=1 Tax=Rhodococcus erythropolis group TaxID=2840174 RepID=UPI001BE73CE4|nr:MULTISPECIES: iron-containing redox enzyme family protein [Rhodococcus erythropolis group]MBT2269665.1 iron-containing redox enzyme family protein [Rhodococcus erythropolis]MBT2274182.1 iron-containing redox enzyme family protein [Rhodococcus qingshengii]
MSSTQIDRTSTHPSASHTRMPIPSARGPVSARLIALLSGSDASPRTFPAVAGGLAEHHSGRSILFDDDAQLTLTLLYELHLQGIDGVSDIWEWDLDLLAGRATLEKPFEAAIHEITQSYRPEAFGRGDVVSALWAMTAPSSGPSMSKYMATEASADQFREVLIHRSLNQLRESDVHTLGIPRLAGAPKAALVEVQADEYGGGRYERMHSTLFATTMRELNLSDEYAHYLDVVPAVTLAALNALSFFGLHRRHLGALVGHLCAVETTSSLPSKNYSAGLRRLGFSPHATLFYDEHVEADSVHEQIAVRDLAGGLTDSDPTMGTHILFGAAACLAFDDLLAEHITGSWAQDESSLRPGTGRSELT